MKDQNVIHSDSPISKQEEDAFQRFPFANRIASVIKGHSGSDSFVMGVYGKWGEGKSSVLNFIKNELNRDDSTIIIDFNPWLFANEDQLLLSFFNVLATGIDRPLKNRRERVGKTLLEYADAIGTLGSLVGLSGSKGVFQSLGKKLSETTIDEYKDRVSEALGESGKRILVVIDDIDRLSISEVQIIFRLIKLVANFKNTIYLLSFDDELVASALDTTYSKGGYDYLEKIIQLPLRLPKAQLSHVRTYTLNSLSKALDVNEISIDGEEAYRFSRAFDDHFLRLIVTPRVAVRFANSISFSIPLLKGEVNMVDLLMVEGVKVTLPDLYSHIRSNASLFASNYGSYRRDDYKKRDEAKAKIDKILESYDSDLRGNIKKMLIEIFPQLDAVFGNMSFSENTWREWYELKRICSGRYFERYFTYVVLEGQISDVIFDELKDRLGEEDFRSRQEKLVQFFSGLDGAEVALKFQFLEESFVQAQKENLALNLCLVGDLFPVRGSGGFTIMAPFQQMAYFIQKCVAGQEKEFRAALGVKLMERALPMDFAFEIWRTLHPRSDGGARPDVLSESDFLGVSKVLYKRCRNEFSLNELFEAVEDSYFRYFLNIGGEEEQDMIKRDVMEWLEADEANFMRLIYAYSQTTQTFNKSFKSHFSVVFYQELKEVVDIEFFHSKSLELFGDHSDFQPTSDRDELSDEQLVGWFQKVHLEKKDTDNDNN
jgi:hypothetical protein